MAKKIFRAPRIRVPRKIKKDKIIEMRVKVSHNSYTGLKIVDGKYVSNEPAYYLKRMEFYYGDEMACSYDMTAATSPNPLIRFKLRATKEAPVRVVVTNNEGVVKEAKNKIKFV